MNINNWVDRAVKYVPLRREREAVREELLDHYCDQLEALEAQGYDQEEAEAKALDALGDPDEIGRLLRRVHRPWLTILIRLCWVCLAVLILLSLIEWEALRSGAEDLFSGPEELQRFSDPMLGLENVSAAAWREGSCAEKAEVGDFTASVYSASSWYQQTDYEDNTYASSGCRVIMCLEAPPWRKPDESALSRGLRAVDELGFTYRSDAPGWVSVLPAEERVGLLQTPGGLRISWLGSSLTKHYYLLTFLNRTFYDSFADTDRLDIHIQYGLADAVLSVQFGPRQMRDLIERAPEAAIQRELIDGMDQDAWATSSYEYTDRGDVLVLCRAEGSAEPVSAGALSLSVPCARIYDRINLPNGERQKLEGSAAWDRMLREANFYPEVGGGEIRDLQTLHLILALRGPTDRLPLGEAELFGRLTVTAEHQGPLPLDSPSWGSSYYACGWERLGAWMDPGNIRHRDGVFFYHVTILIDHPDDSYNLRYERDGEVLSLRLELQTAAREVPR